MLIIPPSRANALHPLQKGRPPVTQQHIPQRILNAVLNLAVAGVTVQQVTRRLRISTALAQQALTTLLHQGKLYETRSTKKTLYHTIRTFINRLAQQVDETLYGRVTAHMTRHPNRKWPERELAQHLGVSPQALQAVLTHGLAAGQYQKSHVGALRLYALA